MDEDHCREGGDIMTWQDVLDVKPGKYFGHITVFAKAARLLGYKFIAWEGRVYFLLDEVDIMDTGVAVDQLQTQIA
jgi:hypothetical protein